MMLLIPFSFNQATIFLYKYSRLQFNKSVFNWTFCQLHYSRKNPIVRNFEQTVRGQVETEAVGGAQEEAVGDDRRAATSSGHRPDIDVIKLFPTSVKKNRQNKLECLSLASIFSMR